MRGVLTLFVFVDLGKMTPSRSRSVFGPHADSNLLIGRGDWDSLFSVGPVGPLLLLQTLQDEV